MVTEGQQARADLQKLIEAVSGDPSIGDTSDPSTASYVADLLESASINEFGFVSASAGQPLELCLPEGSTKLTLFSDPIVLWEGLATSDAYPVVVTIPSGIECGQHRLNATGTGVDESVTFNVDGACVAAGSTSGSSLLPRTGAELGRVLGVALAMVAIGFSIVRGRRARAVAGTVDR